MYNIEFNPYEGPNYSESKFKLLVLGESHYASELINKSSDPEQISRRLNFTNEIVNKYLNYKSNTGLFERWMNTFTKFANVLSQKKLSNNELIDFWSSVAFYNYIQVPTPGPGISPTKQDFENSFDAFKKVCMKLRPTFIIFWGERLYKNFPKGYYRTEKIDDTLSLNILKFDIEIPFMYVLHPSSKGFNLQKSTGSVDYINKIRNHLS
jgi:hypothetical protein